MATAGGPVSAPLFLDGAGEAAAAAGTLATRNTAPPSGHSVAIVDGHAILPEGLEAVPSHAFAHDESLVAATLPASTIRIGRNAFEGCTSLGYLELPESVSRISESAFCGCVRLTEISFGPHVTVLADSAFRGCLSLTHVELPPSVREIGWHAFDGCENLTHVSIPPSVGRIGGFAFHDCPLASVTLGSDTEVAPQSFAARTKVYRAPIDRKQHEAVQYLPQFHGLGFRACAPPVPARLPHGLRARLCPSCRLAPRCSLISAPLARSSRHTHTTRTRACCVTHTRMQMCRAIFPHIFSVSLCDVEGLPLSPVRLTRYILATCARSYERQRRTEGEPSEDKVVGRRYVPDATQPHRIHARASRLPSLPEACIPSRFPQLEYTGACVYAMCMRVCR